MKFLYDVIPTVYETEPEAFFIVPPFGEIADCAETLEFIKQRNNILPRKKVFIDLIFPKVNFQEVQRNAKPHKQYAKPHNVIIPKNNYLW